MTLAFLLDEDVQPAVAAALRKWGIDAVSLHELGAGGLGVPDGEVLRLAISEGRVLVSFNRDDVQRLDGEMQRTSSAHAGIVWCSERTFPRRRVGDLSRALRALSERHDSLDGLCVPLPRA